jgi:hypothetical protein
VVLKLSALDIAISQRLQPLRETLADAGIPVVCLPKEVGQYSIDEVSAIHILIPQAIAVGDAQETPGYQS